MTVTGGQRERMVRLFSAAGACLAALLFLQSPAAFGQSRELLTADDLTVTWGGYLKSISTVSVPGRGGEVWNGAVTLRLKTEANWRDRVTLTLHYEMSALWGGSLSNHAYRSAALADPDVFANLWWPIGEADRIVASHTLDRAYLTVRADPVNVIVGRQRIGWGVARFISPVDLFNPFDPLAIDKEERRGTDALVTEIALGPSTGMSLVFAPARDMDEASYAARLYTNRFSYDVSLIAGRFADREVYGLDFSGQVWNIAVWGEAAWNQEDEGTVYAVADPTSPLGFSTRRSKSGYLRAALGAQYIFPNTLSLLAEYYYNGKGAADADDYDWTTAADGSEPALGRHYLFASVGYQITPLLTGDFSAVCNLTDGSVVLAPSVEYSLTEDLYLSAGAQVGIGESRTEYGDRPEFYYLQVRYYF